MSSKIDIIDYVDQNKKTLFAPDRFKELKQEAFIKKLKESLHEWVHETDFFDNEFNFVSSCFAVVHLTFNYHLGIKLIEDACGPCYTFEFSVIESRNSDVCGGIAYPLTEFAEAIGFISYLDSKRRN